MNSCGNSYERSRVQFLKVVIRPNNMEQSVLGDFFLKKSIQLSTEDISVFHLRATAVPFQKYRSGKILGDFDPAWL